MDVFEQIVKDYYEESLKIRCFGKRLSEMSRKELMSCYCLESFRNKEYAYDMAKASSFKNNSGDNGMEESK